MVRDNTAGDLEVNLGSGENSYYQIDDTAGGTRSITTAGANSSVVNNNPNVAMTVTCGGEGSTNITTASSKDTITIDSTGTGTVNIKAVNGGTINLENPEDVERLNLETAQDTPDDLFNSIMTGGIILDGGSLNLNGGDSDSNITLNVAKKTTADNAETVNNAETANSDDTPTEDTSTETTAFENNVNTSKKLSRLQELGASISTGISNITKSIAGVLKQAMTNIGSLFSRSSGYMEKFYDEEDTEELTTAESESTIAEVTSDATFINLTTGDGTTHKYGFVGKEGGNLDGSVQDTGAVLVGNYANNSGWAGANITGGDGDDTILAGNADTVNVSSGDDVVKINSGSEGATVKYNALNAAVNGAMDMVLEGSIAGSSKNTMIEGFKAGFGNNADALEITSSDEFVRELGTTVDTSAGDKFLDNLSFNFNDGNFNLEYTESTYGDSDNELMYNLGDVVKHTFTFKSEDAASSAIKLNIDGVAHNTAFIDSSAVYKVDSADSVDLVIGSANSAVDFGDVSNDVVVDLSSTFVDDKYSFNNVEGFKGGAGDSTLIGSNDSVHSYAFYGGTGDSTILSGRGDDTMYGYTGTDKTGSTTFMYFDCQGNDLIKDFNFGTGDTSDRIWASNGIQKIKVLEDNVEIYSNGIYKNRSTDCLTVDGAKNEVMKITDVDKDIVLQLGDDLKYDAKVDIYGDIDHANNKITITSDVTEAVSLVLAGNEATKYWNVTKVDATDYSGNATLIGATKYFVNGELVEGADCELQGGAGRNTLWGGTGNDTLIGGSGKNNFFYFANGDGDDVIQGAHKEDVIQIVGSLDDVDLNSLNNVNATGFTLKMNSGGSLTVSGTDLEKLTLKIGDTRWKLNSEGSAFSRKE